MGMRVSPVFCWWESSFWVAQPLGAAIECFACPGSSSRRGKPSAILSMRLLNKIWNWRRSGLCVLLCLALSAMALAQSGPATTTGNPASTTAPTEKKKHSTTGHSTAKHGSSAKSGKTTRGKKGSRKRGQQAIDSTRAREIQTALIREHYMQGEPTGKWDASTQAAMQKYQADQGWQSKQIPDSRALIKLGLGPSHDHLLNPESAMTMPATPATADPKTADPKVPPQHQPPKQ